MYLIVKPNLVKRYSIIKAFKSVMKMDYLKKFSKASQTMFYNKTF